jgi:aspartate/methionine/tyrosine aminotransferase
MFRPPPYPYEQLNKFRILADSIPGGVVDLSIGTPCDPVPEIVRKAITSETSLDSARPYPSSVGSDDFLKAASEWLNRCLRVQIHETSIGACIGSKEIVTGLPAVLKLRNPDKDTVLYPAVSYPSYSMGAQLAKCRSVAVPVDENWKIDLSRIDKKDIERAICLWVNSPGNPAGGIEDLEMIAKWGKENEVTILSDECYVEFTWATSPKSVLQSSKEGVIAIHSLSKRSNLAGMRVGFYAGDEELVSYLREVRKHQGFMLSGPAQIAGVAALTDQQHADKQKRLYLGRLSKLITIFESLGIKTVMPEGSFYLWIAVPDGDEWQLVEKLAKNLGMVVTPGEFFGEKGKGYIRVAAVATDDRIELLEQRAGV